MLLLLLFGASVDLIGDGFVLERRDTYFIRTIRQLTGWDTVKPRMSKMQDDKHLGNEERYLQKT